VLLYKKGSDTCEFGGIAVRDWDLGVCLTQSQDRGFRHLLIR